MADFVHRVGATLDGYGIGGQREVDVDNVHSAGSNNIALTFSPGVKAGKGRLRSKDVAANTTTTSIKVVGTDGTTPKTIYHLPASVAAANEEVELTFEFNSDVAFTTITATIVTATDDSTWDFEVSGIN